MPKAGTYDYPIKDLDDSISYLEQAHKVAHSLVMKREGFAKALNMAASGGGFGMIVGTLGMYGLIETGEGDIRFTDLAQKLLFGTAKEKESLKNQAVRNIRLFAEIVDRFHQSPTEEQLRFFLREKANLEVAKEAKVAEEVGKLFYRNVKYLQSSGGVEKKMQVHTGLGQESTGNGLFTIIANGLTIDVDSLLKLKLVETLVQDAKTKLSKTSEPEKSIDEKATSDEQKRE